MMTEPDKIQVQLSAGSLVCKFTLMLLIFAMSRYLFILLTTPNPNPKP